MYVGPRVLGQFEALFDPLFVGPFRVTVHADGGADLTETVTGDVTAIDGPARR